MHWRWLWFSALACLLLATTTAQWPNVFVDGKIYFVDADCYARMTRVQHVLAHPFQRISHHAFENFPQGTDVHTTAPLDWAIALLAAAISPFSPRALDLAGAWISPLLGLATLLVLWIWSTRVALPFRSATLLLVAASPIMVQAFRLGRPDHQSLLIFLLATALAAELSLWNHPSRQAALLSGCAWGLALWTSLYEPLVLLALILILRILILRRAAFSRSWTVSLGVLLGIFFIGVLFDGWRVSNLPPEVVRYFPNWSRTIGELAHLSPLSQEFVGWLGWLAPALPFLLVWRLWKNRDPRPLALLVLLLATYALTCWQLRWGCYFTLVAALAMPFALDAIPSRALAWTAFALSLLPVAQQWDKLLDLRSSPERVEQRLDYAQLREVATVLQSLPQGGVLAPWWLSPPLAYWSGQPCLAGSSHESLPGIVDSARFYLGTDPQAAARILIDRQIRYVIAYEPSRVLSTAATLMDETPSSSCLGVVLYDTPHLAPPGLAMVYSNAFFKLYEVKRDGL